MHAQLTTEGPAYWETLVESQHLSIQGSIAFANDEMEEAEQLMMSATEVEDSVAKSPVTPSAVLPARGLYGDMPSLMGKHEQALEAYETALNISPNLTRSLRGAMNERVGVQIFTCPKIK